MKKTILTVLLTAGCLIGGTVAYLYDAGNIEVSKVEQSHSRKVIVDGIVEEDSTWVTLNGYKVSINLYDGTYVGR